MLTNFDWDKAKKKKIEKSSAQLLGEGEKLSFFESAISDFFFQKKKICFIPIKISQHLWDRKDF